jgi:hypothetical protein
LRQFDIRDRFSQNARLGGEPVLDRLRLAVRDVPGEKEIEPQEGSGNQNEGADEQPAE